MSSSAAPARIVLVTVTYGDRHNLLVQCLQAARAQGVSHAVVVDNGSRGDLLGLVSSIFPNASEVVQLGRNTGSAYAFAQGLRAAQTVAPDYILLLDDDNRIEPDALPALLTHLRDVIAERRSSLAAVFAYREARGGIAAVRKLQEDLARGGAFLGFDIADAFAKLGRRLRPQRGGADLNQQEIELVAGPYGGMLIPGNLLDQIGLPDDRFVLYGDDWEFTHRIVAAGGALRMLQNARVTDLETAWSAKGGLAGGALWGWINGGSDAKAYYTARNHTFFESRRLKPRPVRRRLNRAAYMALLYAEALRRGRLGRLKILQSAIADGERELLGPCPKFPLHITSDQGPQIKSEERH